MLWALSEVLHNSAYSRDRNKGCKIRTPQSRTRRLFQSMGAFLPIIGLRVLCLYTGTYVLSIIYTHVCTLYTLYNSLQPSQPLHNTRASRDTVRAQLANHSAVLGLVCGRPLGVSSGLKTTNHESSLHINSERLLQQATRPFDPPHHGQQPST